MPNGTVAHFPLRCSELVEMLGEFDAETVIGDVAARGGSTFERLTIDALKQCEECLP